MGDNAALSAGVAAGLLSTEGREEGVAALVMLMPEAEQDCRP
jgi:hypothetical protein